MSTPAGWYPDTEVPGGERWWNGSFWSDSRRAAEKPKPAAGWYDDPEMVNTRRYWDGAAWTAHRQEKAAGGPANTRTCPYCASSMSSAATRCASCGGELRWCKKDQEWVGARGRPKWVGVARGGTLTQYRCMKCDRVVDGPRF